MPRSAASSKFRSAAASSRCGTRADRIEQLADGSFAILDYKTGRVPTQKEVRSGLVAAAHARSRDPARRRVRRFRRWRSRFRRSPTSRFAAASRRASSSRSTWDDTTPDAQADRALAKLTGVIAKFGEPKPRLPLQGAAAVPAPLSRRLRPSGARQGMVAVRRRGRGRGGERMNAAHPAAGGHRQPARRLRPVGVGLGVGQRRHRQDARAGAARHPAAAGDAAPTRRKSSASPSPRRRPPTWRTASSTRCANGSRSTTTSSTPRSAPPAQSRRHQAARARPAPVRRRAGDAGRPEGADHPRLLHAAASAISVRGQRAGALPRAGRGRAAAARWSSFAAPCCSRPPTIPTARPAARSPRSSRPRRTSDSQEGLLEAIRERERLLGLDRPRRRHRAGGGAAFRRARHRSGDTLEAVETEILDGPHLPSSDWMSVAGICSHRHRPTIKTKQTRLQNAIAATGRTRIEAYLEIFFHRQRRLREVAPHQALAQSISRSRATFSTARRTASPRFASGARRS